MPDALEELAQEKIKELLKKLPVEKLLAALSPEARADGPYAITVTC